MHHERNAARKRSLECPLRVGREHGRSVGAGFVDYRENENRCAIAVARIWHCGAKGDDADGDQAEVDSGSPASVWCGAGLAASLAALRAFLHLQHVCHRPQVGAEPKASRSDGILREYTDRARRRFLERRKVLRQNARVRDVLCDVSEDDAATDGDGATDAKNFFRPTQSRRERGFYIAPIDAFDVDEGFVVVPLTAMIPRLAASEGLREGNLVGVLLLGDPRSFPASSVCYGLPVRVLLLAPRAEASFEGTT